MSLDPWRNSRGLRVSRLDKNGSWCLALLIEPVDKTVVVEFSD